MKKFNLFSCDVAKVVAVLVGSLTAGASLGHGQTVIIDGTTPDYVNNGSFESTSFWWGGTATTLSDDLGLELGVLLRTGPATPSDGTFYNVVAVDGSGVRGVYLDTGYDLVEGDMFDLSFYQGNHNGIDSGDEFAWQLFTTTDDTANGTVKDIVASSQVAANTSQTLAFESYSSLGTVTQSMAGDRLFIAFTPSTNMSGDYLALDQVNLATAIPEPASAVLISGFLMMGVVALSRRGKRRS